MSLDHDEKCSTILECRALAMKNEHTLGDSGGVQFVFKEIGCMLISSVYVEGRAQPYVSSLGSTYSIRFIIHARLA